MDEWDMIISKIESLTDEMRDAAKRVVRRSQNRVKAAAKQLAPVGDTGLLRNSIHSTPVVDDGLDIYGDVGSYLEYAVYVEMGTGQRGAASPSPPKSDKPASYREDWAGMKAQPYLYPSLKQEEAVFEEDLAQTLRGVLDG